MKRKFRMNPIMKKELVVGSRSIKMSIAILGINLFLVLIVILIMATTNMASGSSGYDYSALLMIFPVLGCTEVGLLSLIVPIITSGSISGEREKQTLEIMLTTPVTPFSIALGKLGSAMTVVMMYMISSIPIMSIAFVLGGMSWWALIGLIGMLLYLGIYVGSVGVFCSSVVKKSIAATILTIAIGIGILVATSTIFYTWIGIWAYRSSVGSSVSSPVLAPIVMMFNPYSPIFDFMLRSMTSTSVYGMIDQAFMPSGLLVPLYKGWIPVSVALNLLISAGFLKLAGRNISVTRNNKKRK